MKIHITLCSECPHGEYSSFSGHTRCKLESRFVGELSPIPDWCPIKGESPVISTDAGDIADFFSRVKEHQKGDIGKRRLASLWILSQFTELSIPEMVEVLSELLEVCEQVVES